MQPVGNGVVAKWILKGIKNKTANILMPFYKLWYGDLWSTVLVLVTKSQGWGEMH